MVCPWQGTHTTVDLPVKEVRGLLADIPETRVQTLLCCLEEVGGIHIQSPLTEAFIKVVCCEDFHDKVVITKFTDLTVTLLELQEQSKIQELGCLYEALKCIACGSFEECFDYDQTHIVREAIENYFISSSDDRIGECKLVFVIIFFKIHYQVKRLLFHIHNSEEVIYIGTKK